MSKKYKADNKKDKKNEIEKIRKGNLNINAHSDIKNEINLQKELKEIKKRMIEKKLTIMKKNSMIRKDSE